MEAFWKATAVILLTIILGATLGKTEKDITIVLSAATVCIVVTVAMHYLSDVISFLWELGKHCADENPFLGTLLKISGVALITELVCLISSDAGNSSLGKAMQMLGNAAIMFLSLPLLKGFLSIIQEILDFI